jgi:hypothetical protein
MPVTFNSNNNYSVDIVTEPDVLNPTVVQYSSDTNTPFVEIKITPDIFQYPLVAGNLNFDSLPRFIKHEPSLNINNSCTPLSTPHGVNSSFTYEEIIGTNDYLPNGQGCYNSGANMVTTSSQGPYQSERNGATIYGDLLANGVAWTKVIWVEVYADDNGDLINDQFSPSTNESEHNWVMYNVASGTVTTYIYPVYIKAFVFLEYGPSGPGGLSSNINIQIDIDENTPVYGCTNVNATNYYAGATIDDGSCTFPPTQYSITFSPDAANAAGPYTSIFTTSGFGLNSSVLKNYRFNGDGLAVTLANTYAAGDGVAELVEIDLVPVQPTIGFNNYEAVYDFPITGTYGGPEYNLDPLDPTTGFGDSQNNLTAASIRFLNLNGYDALSQVPVYISQSDPSYVQPNWISDTWADLTGNVPSTIVYFGEDLETVDDNGNPLTIGTDGIQIEEIYDDNSTSEWILNPGYEWFPFKLKVSIQLDFIMPAHDLNIVLELDHNTENQGGII